MFEPFKLTLLCCRQVNCNLSTKRRPRIKSQVSVAVSDRWAISCFTMVTQWGNKCMHLSLHLYYLLWIRRWLAIVVVVVLVVRRCSGKCASNSNGASILLRIWAKLPTWSLAATARPFAAFQTVEHFEQFDGRDWQDIDFTIVCPSRQ